MSHAARLHRWLSENQSVMERLVGGVPSLLHGRLPEAQRRSIMRRFQMGDIRYLVCTDLVSRGLDTTMVRIGGKLIDRSSNICLSHSLTPSHAGRSRDYV